MQIHSSSAIDCEAVLELNREYIRSVQTSDVQWFRRTLQGDFRCSLPDGTIIDRDRFLERAARPLDISNLEVHDVEVRLLGDVAIVHARTTFSTPAGSEGSGRYTDVWSKRDGRWMVAAAHFTRSAA
jgi:hypothetical protein